MSTGYLKLNVSKTGSLISPSPTGAFVFSVWDTTFYSTRLFLTPQSVSVLPFPLLSVSTAAPHPSHPCLYSWNRLVAYTSASTLASLQSINPLSVAQELSKVENRSVCEVSDPLMASRCTQNKWSLFPTGSQGPPWSGLPLSMCSTLSFVHFPQATVVSLLFSRTCPGSHLILFFLQLGTCFTRSSLSYLFPATQVLTQISQKFSLTLWAEETLQSLYHIILFYLLSTYQYLKWSCLLVQVLFAISPLEHTLLEGRGWDCAWTT